MSYMTVITQQNDTLDAVLHRTLGRTDIIEDVITANPHAIRLPVLPAGVEVRIPDLPKAKPTKTTIKLWD